MSGDAIGNFTHLNSNHGESTIDYSICNKHLYGCIENFMVLPLNEISDHSKIITVFKSSIPISNQKLDKYNWNPLPDRFKWDAKNKKRFVDALKNSLDEIDDITQRIEAGLINSTGEKFQSLFSNAAQFSLENKQNRADKNWKKRKKSKSGLIKNVKI